MMKKDEELSEQDKVTMEWDSMAGEWDDLASWYANALYKHMIEKVPILRESKPTRASSETGGKQAAASSSSQSPLVIVDFGCGTGLLTEKLRRHVGSGDLAAHVVAIDASPKMIDMVQDKVRDHEWDNVKAHSIVLANVLAADGEGADSDALKGAVKELYGTVDIIVASSVMNFIPDSDLESTMKIIGMLLKPDTGIFCHSDWTDHGDSKSMTDETAQSMYEMGNLQADLMEVFPMAMPSSSSPPPDDGKAADTAEQKTMNVFFGVAKKNA